MDDLGTVLIEFVESVFAIPTEWTTAELEGGPLSLSWAGATASFTLYSSRGRPLHISMAPSA